MRPRDDVQEARWRAEFAADPALQREFGGSCEAWLAFRRNEHRSQVLCERRPAGTDEQQLEAHGDGDAVQLSASAPGGGITHSRLAELLQWPSAAVLRRPEARAILARFGISPITTDHGERWPAAAVRRLAANRAELAALNDVLGTLILERESIAGGGVELRDD